jgi:hypothetical protein
MRLGCGLLRGGELHGGTLCRTALLEMALREGALRPLVRATFSGRPVRSRDIG